MEEVLKPQAVSGDGNAIADEIERYVRSRTRGMVRDLRVEVIGEQIVLSGRTSTYHVKQLATNGAQHALEDRQLVNDIEVV